MPNKFKIKDENLLFFMVEMNDDFDESVLTDEERQEIQRQNDIFEERVIDPAIFSKVAPCQCQMPRIQQRIQSRLAILGEKALLPNGQIQMEIEQEDVDAYQFGVIVECLNGVYQRLLFLVRRCKGCQIIQQWGEIGPYVRMLVDIFDKFHDTDFAEPEERAIPKEGEFILENTETGERTEAGSLGELFGSIAESGELSLDKPEGTGPSHKVINLTDRV